MTDEVINTEIPAIVTPITDTMAENAPTVWDEIIDHPLKYMENEALILFRDV